MFYRRRAGLRPETLSTSLPEGVGYSGVRTWVQLETAIVMA